jgi:hypothetical protein
MRGVRNTPLWKRARRRNRVYHLLRIGAACVLIVAVCMFLALVIDIVKDLPTYAGHAAGDFIHAMHQSEGDDHGPLPASIRVAADRPLGHRSADFRGRFRFHP